MAGSFIFNSYDYYKATLNTSWSDNTLTGYGAHTVVSGKNEPADDYMEISGHDLTISAGKGNDTISLIGIEEAVNGGGEGGAHNIIYGDAGDDSITMRSLWSTVFAGTGNDTVQIFQNSAVIYGGEGDDYIFFNAQGGMTSSIYSTYNTRVTVGGGSGSDTIELKPLESSLGDEYTVLLTDFSNEDVLIIDDYEERYLTFKIDNGNLIICDNKTVGYVSNEVNDTVRVGGTNLNVTIQGISDIDEFSDAKFYRYYNETLTDEMTFENLKSIINPSIYTYSGGYMTISDYRGEQINIAADYKGFDVKGHSICIDSEDGQLEIQNARDKVISYGDANGNLTAYSYLASSGGVIDGRNYDKAEIIIGRDNSANQIYAGSGGSSLWGGTGGADTLIGGEGYDEFFFARGSGIDVIQNALQNDLINLSDITLDDIISVDVTESAVNLRFIDGGNLYVEGNSGVSYKLGEKIYAVNQSTKEWTEKIKS